MTRLEQNGLQQPEKRGNILFSAVKAYAQDVKAGFQVLHSAKAGPVTGDMVHEGITAGVGTGVGVHLAGAGVGLGLKEATLFTAGAVIGSVAWPVAVAAGVVAAVAVGTGIPAAIGHFNRS